MVNQSLNVLLQKVHSLFTKKLYLEAITQCEYASSLYKNNKDILHLKALCLVKLQRNSEAESSFQLALACSSNKDLNILTNFANFLYQNNKLEDALEIYKKLTVLNPSEAFYWKCIAIILNKLQEYEQALLAVNKAIKLSALDIALYNIKGAILKNSDDYDLAIKTFKEALNIDNNNSEILYHLSLCYRAIGEFQGALDIIKSLIIQNPNNPELLFQEGCLFYDLDNIEKSENSLVKSISLNPEYSLAHETLSKLRWENQNINTDFLESYHLYMKTNDLPSVQMCFSLANQYLLSESLEDAEETVLRSLRQHKNSYELEYLLSSIYSRDSEKLDKSAVIFNNLLRQRPNDVRVLLDLAVVHIRLGDYASAISLLEKALILDKDNQEVWAYLGICWKYTQNEKYDWLNDFDSLVYHGEFNFKTINRSSRDFKEEIVSELNRLHRSVREPLDQTVRHGTQTMGNLFNKSSQVFNQLEVLLTEQFENFRSQLNYDENHPFLSKIRRPFYFKGAWSILLQNKGFHTNHFHPRGWISGPSYISIPDHFDKNDKSKEGWIKLGETSLKLGEKDVPSLELCPVENTCIFFPSYMWHGTHPVSSNNKRITVSYDVSVK